jgi:hypothetical protein
LNPPVELRSGRSRVGRWLEGLLSRLRRPRSPDRAQRPETAGDAALRSADPAPPRSDAQGLPGGEEGPLDRAERLLTEGRTPLGRALLEELSQSAPPPLCHRAQARLGALLVELGAMDEARRAIELLLAASFDDPEGQRLLMRIDQLRPAARPLPIAGPASGATLAGLPSEGIHLGGYQLLEQLGRGSAGSVYRARDVALDRDVALKLLHPRLRRDARRALLFEEARLAAAVQHPGIVLVYELDEERLLLVEEFCCGGSLRTRLATAPPDPLRALRLGLQLFDALAALHSVGISHGDLKPANLLLRGSGELVLCDFGLARLSDAAPRDIAGTRAYMSPEQRRGERPLAADLFSAGVVLLELLERRRDGAPRLLDATRHVLGARRSEAVEALLSGLGRSAPEERPTAQEAAQRLQELLDEDARPAAPEVPPGQGAP